MRLRDAIVYGSVITMLGLPANSVELSPTTWPVELRNEVETHEADSWTPNQSRSISGKMGLVATIASPIAVQAGLAALRQGGTAADAAATVALTQITTQLGSVASFAGILSLLYYKAKSNKVYSLDAGFNSYLNEMEPASIPACDLSELKQGANTSPSKGNLEALPAVAGDCGRKTLVPGFMAGIEAMHKQFGRLPFAVLFAPAIHYAENGLLINPALEYFFATRGKYLARTPEGQAFLNQAGGKLPKIGDRFFQPALAKTLQNVAQSGSQYMYKGEWAKHFVELVRREGGNVTLNDMSRYKVIWNKPLSTTYLGYSVYAPGNPSASPYHILTGLNLLEQLKLQEKDSYWKDPKVLRDLQRIADVTDMAPQLDQRVAAFLKSKRIDTAPESQLTKAYATAVAPLLNQIQASLNVEPKHSDSIVVIDKDGNIAAMTHTINTVIWGDTGIVVDGIPIPDSAGFQQNKLAAIARGGRLPNEMTQTIVFQGKTPFMATAAIGSSLVPETLKVLLEVVGKRSDLALVQAAPALLNNFMLAEEGSTVTERAMALPDGAYDKTFVNNLRDLGEKVTEVSPSTTRAIRGTVVTAIIDPKTGARYSSETPHGLIVTGAY